MSVGSSSPGGLSTTTRRSFCSPEEEESEDGRAFEDALVSLFSWVSAAAPTALAAG